MVSRFGKYMKNIRNIRMKYLKLKYGLSLLKIHEKYKKYIFRIIFYVSLIKNDKQKKEKKLTFLNHLLALDNVFSKKSEEQEVNLVWPNLFNFWLPFKFVSFWRGLFSISRCWALAASSICLSFSFVYSGSTW